MILFLKIIVFLKNEKISYDISNFKILSPAEPKFKTFAKISAQKISGFS